MEEDLTERAEEEEAGDSDEERPTQVGGDRTVNFTAWNRTAWRSTPPQKPRMQRHNIIRSHAKPTNIPGVMTDILKLFDCTYLLKVSDIIVTHTNTEAERVYAEKQSCSMDENENSTK